MINPQTIPGLNLWFDAADLNTVNDGRVTDKSTVYKFVDKVNGVVLRNNSGIYGPSYAIGAVDGKNAINFYYYQPTSLGGTHPNDRSITSLTNSNVTQLNTGTYSLFVVYKPITKNFQNVDGNQGFIMSVWEQTLVDYIKSFSTNPPASWGLRHLATGDSRSTSTPQEGRNNPSGLWIEGNQSAGAYGTWFWAEELHSRSLEESSIVTSPSLLQTTVATIRSQNSLRKIGWMKQNSQNLEDTVMPVVINTANPRGLSALGSPRPPAPNQYVIDPLYYRSRYGSNNDGLKSSYAPKAGGTWLTLGSFAPISNILTLSSYPFEGYFCELLHYDRFLNDEETNAVREYLKSKWFPTRRYLFEQVAGTFPSIISAVTFQPKISTDATARLGDPFAGNTTGTTNGQLWYGVTASIAAGNVSEIGLIKSTTNPNVVFSEDQNPLRLFGVDQPTYATNWNSSQGSWATPTFAPLTYQIPYNSVAYYVRLYVKSAYDKFAYSAAKTIPMVGIDIVSAVYRKDVVTSVFQLFVAANIAIPPIFTATRKGYTFKNIGTNPAVNGPQYDPYYNGTGTSIVGTDRIVGSGNTSWAEFGSGSALPGSTYYRVRCWVELTVDGGTRRYWSSSYVDVPS